MDLCLPWTSGGLWGQGQRQGHGQGQVYAGIQDPQRPAALLCLRGQEPEWRRIERRALHFTSICCPRTQSPWPGPDGSKAQTSTPTRARPAASQRCVRAEHRQRGMCFPALHLVRIWVRISYNAPKAKTTQRPGPRYVCVCIFSKRK